MEKVSRPPTPRVIMGRGARGSMLDAAWRAWQAEMEAECPPTRALRPSPPLCSSPQLLLGSRQDTVDLPGRGLTTLVVRSAKTSLQTRDPFDSQALRAGAR